MKEAEASMASLKQTSEGRLSAGAWQIFKRSLKLLVQCNTLKVLSFMTSLGADFFVNTGS